MEAIKAQDVRVGNILNHEKHRLIEVLGINPHCGDYKIEASIGWVYLKNCSPIPLTEELLLRCGAKKFSDVRFRYDRFLLTWKPEYNYWYVLDSQMLVYLTKIEFLHEWQNFVFVMNGAELPYSETA